MTFIESIQWGGENWKKQIKGSLWVPIFSYVVPASDSYPDEGHLSAQVQPSSGWHSSTRWTFLWTQTCLDQCSVFNKCQVCAKCDKTNVFDVIAQITLSGWFKRDIWLCWEQKLAGCHHMHVTAEYYGCQRKQQAHLPWSKPAALMHYTHQNIVKRYHSQRRPHINCPRWSADRIFMQELLGCVQRTKPVRSRSERHKLVVCFVQLHVLPKTEEKWVNNLRWAYKSIVFAVSKELGADEGLQIFLNTFPTKIPPSYTNLEMFTYTTWKHDASSVSQCRPVSVCGQRRPLALVTPARERVRGVG